MKKIICLIIIIFIIIISVSSCSQKQIISSGENWTVGYGEYEIKADIFDGGKYYIAGYRNGFTATGILDYQMSKAVWIDDNSGYGGILVIVIDCIGLGSGDINKIKDSLKNFKKDTNCRAIHIISTHTHAGIDTLGLWGKIGIGSKDVKFMSMLYDSAVLSAKAAYNSRCDGELLLGTAEVEDIIKDSREPYIYSKTLTSIRFSPFDNSKNGIRILNFASHAESLGSKNTLVSADFPCYTAKEIYEATKDKTIFIPAAIGGLLKTTEINLNNAVDNAKETGIVIAKAALSINNETLLLPSIYIDTLSVDIPCENTLFVTMKFLGALSSKIVDGKGNYKLSIHTTLTYMKLGTANILMLPGEIFPELVYGTDFKGSNKELINPTSLCDIFGNDLIIFGLADDEIGYIVTPNDFVLDKKLPYLTEAAGKHYEETNSLGPNTAYYIKQISEKLLKRYNNALNKK